MIRRMPRHGFERFSSTQSAEVPWRLGLPLSPDLFEGIGQTSKNPQDANCVGLFCGLRRNGPCKADEYKCSKEK